MAGLNHQACAVLDLASAARSPDRALLSKHSNQNLARRTPIGQANGAMQAFAIEMLAAQLNDANLAIDKNPGPLLQT
jgi:hypothetical protein